MIHQAYAKLNNPRPSNCNKVYSTLKTASHVYCLFAIPVREREGFIIMQIVGLFLLCLVLAACNGGVMRQASRMTNFEATQQDFDSIARDVFKTIDPSHSVNFIVVPAGIDPKARKALESVHHVVSAAPGPPGTLPVGYFSLRAFTIEDGEAHVDGQLGPATGRMTAANMPDCGKEYSVAYYMEGGDWVSHAFKVGTCTESRHWVPLDDTAPTH